MKEIFLGVVADDFTGASDAASMLSEAGIPTVLFNGVPKFVPKLRDDIKAIVVAEKTRTIDKRKAVEEMLDAFAWLHSMGTEQLYFKYCATFDSTKEGNIGPVSDAMLKKYGYPYSVLVPALPVNGRTVRDGKLYLNGKPLSESHMRNHPLTPMTESDVTKLMEMQSEYRAYKVTADDLRKWQEESIDTGSRLGLTPEEKKEKYYIVPDYYEDAHGDLIAEVFGNLPFLTGGSGLLGALGRRYIKNHCESKETENKDMEFSERAADKIMILAGSCSKITLEQIAEYREKQNPNIFLDPKKLLFGEIDADSVFDNVKKMGNATLVYSSQEPEDMRRTQEMGLERVAAAIEETMADLTRKAVSSGYTGIISAGGETSGAVTKALDYQAFYIGKSVAPGIPVMIPVENSKLRIVLKSGGFGQTDFFERAVKMISGNVCE